MLYVNAGHIPPLLLHTNGEVELLTEGGVPLGLFEAPRYFEGHIGLEEGDILVLHTDGIVETADKNDDFYGLERLTARIKENADSSATKLCSAIIQDVRRFGRGVRQDDRTLVVMKTNAPEGPAQSWRPGL